MFIYPPSVQQKSNNKECNSTHNSYPESLNGKFIRKHISYGKSGI